MPPRTRGISKEPTCTKKIVNDEKLWQESAKKLKWNWENPKPSRTKSVAEKARRANFKVQNAFNQRITPRLRGNAKKALGTGLIVGLVAPAVTGLVMGSR